jgi:hypothetical protein
VEGERNVGAFHGEAVTAVWNKKGGLDIAEYIQMTMATTTTTTNKELLEVTSVAIVAILDEAL